MKQHVYQIILLLGLIGASYFIFRDDDFANVQTALVDSGVSTEVAGETEGRDSNTVDPLLERREDFLSKLAQTRVGTEFVPDTDTEVDTGPKYIVSKGYALNPDTFFSAQVTQAPTPDSVEGFLQGVASSSSSRAVYSSSTGLITLYTQTGGGSYGGSNDVLNSSYVSELNGVSFKIDKGWKISDKKGSIVIRNVGKDGQSSLVIAFPKGDTVVTHDEVGGDLALTYDIENDQWVDVSQPKSDTGDMETSSSTPSFPVIDTIYSTNVGRPVFAGTTRIETRIVALDTKSFVVINLIGSGKTMILDKFVPTIARVSGL